jgi:hypothetical protein
MRSSHGKIQTVREYLDALQANEMLCEQERRPRFPARSRGSVVSTTQSPHVRFT